MAEPVDPPSDDGSFLDPLFDAILWLGQFVGEQIFEGISVLMLALGALFYAISAETIDLAWSVASEVISGLNISAHIQSAWTGIPAATRSMLGFFRIPEIINLLMSFGVTKFVLRFVPFM